MFKQPCFKNNDLYKHNLVKDMFKIIHIEVSFFVCEMSNDSECQVNFGRNTAN